MFYWVLKKLILGPVLRTLFRPWVLGGEHVPATGGAIFASNHLSFSDSIFLPLMVDRRVTFLAKSDYFTGRGIKGRLTAGFFKGVGQLPVDRSGAGAGDAAIRTGLRVLRRSELLGIYPEGTRSPDGRLYRGKTGVARLALEGKVPVLPVVMVGTAQVQPIGRKIPRIRRVGMIIGRPLDFSRYEGMQGDRFVLRSITDEIMYELMRLSGQEYVDVYASVMKESIAAARKSKAAAPRSARAARELGHAAGQEPGETAAPVAQQTGPHAGPTGPSGPSGPGGRRRPLPLYPDANTVPEGAAPAPVHTSRASSKPGEDAQDGEQELDPSDDGDDTIAV